MLHKNLKPDELQRFMRKNGVKECFVVDGMTFRDKKNAENHCGRNKIEASCIVTVAAEEKEKAKAKVEKQKAEEVK